MHSHTGILQYPGLTFISLAHFTFGEQVGNLYRIACEAGCQWTGTPIVSPNNENDTNIEGKEGMWPVEKVLFMLNGEAESIVQSAISLRKATRRDPPLGDSKWRREDAMLAFFQFISEKGHKGLFQPTEPPALGIDHPNLSYPLNALLELARDIVKTFQDHKTTDYFALDDQEGEEADDLTWLLIASSLCRMKIDYQRWKAESLEEVPQCWSDEARNALVDPRKAEKALFSLDAQEQYTIQEAIKYRLEKRGEPSSGDPDWSNENALLDLLRFLTSHDFEGIFDPVLDNDLADSSKTEQPLPQVINEGKYSAGQSDEGTIDDTVPDAKRLGLEASPGTADAVLVSGV